MKKKWPLVTAVCLVLLLLAGLFQNTPALLYGTEGQPSDQQLAQRLQDVIALYIDSPTALVNNQETKLDAGNDFVTPLIMSNRTIVPVRFIAESLGAQVLWDEKAQTITINLSGKTIQLTLNKTEMKVAGATKTLDAAPVIYLGRTYVPLRAVSEAFDKKVDYKDGLIMIAASSADTAKLWEPALAAQVSSRINGLPVLGSAENLQRLLAGTEDQSIVYSLDSSMKRAANMEAQAAAPSAASADSGSADYSRTNVQVEGVDEGDLVKTDGRYIYQVSGQRVIVSQAYPADAMKVIAVLSTGEADFQPQELYVDESNLVVIGQGYSNTPRVYDQPASAKRMIAPDIYPYYYSSPKTKAVIYSIKDKQNITKLREVELDGNYVSSRKIGSALYLVANQYVNWYRGAEEPIILPAYRDTAVKNEAVEIPYSEIRCFPPVAHPNYLLIAGLDLAKPEEAAQVSAYLGSGESIYVSEDHLFVAVSQRQYRILPLAGAAIAPADNTEKTQIFKFALDQGKVAYEHKGEVPGRILNQFSMDEFKENFRIATTVGYSSWSGSEPTSQNNLYVLDKAMGIIGRIENIAPGEQIYSTRFMGERAFMVTFRTVDPLFVLDLSAPATPKILGALKIPGYSDYLHPYDANHLIGFGKDTVEVAQKDGQGKTIGTTAYYLGMKVALFDVTDVTNPKELFSEKIGDRGTDSELLHNHKALLFDKERNLLAFPVTLMEVKGGAAIDSRSNMPEYGQFTFQGALVYKIDLARGFDLQGRITHMTQEDLLKAGYSYADPAKEIHRILTIEDSLYTLSDSQIKANALLGLKEQNNLLLP